MGKIKISQCMIVKNEEKYIERALSWGMGIVSEQIVVDTGSTDRTVEIARQMGAKVYNFTWIDDFSAAKNYAISKASHEWIAFLDADEYMTEEDAGKVMSCLEKIQNSAYDGIMSAWIHMTGEGQILGVDTQIRIFRNIPTLRYRRRIHEYLTFSGNLHEKNIDMAGEISIYHTGYGEKEIQERKKSERNIKLIEKELKDNPQDFEMWGYLGNEYDNADEWEKTEQAYRKSISLMPGHLDEFDVNASRTFLRLLNLLIRRPDSEEKAVMELYSQAVKRRPMEADYDYLVGQYLAGLGKYQEGERHLRRALELLEQYGNTGKAMLLSAKLQKAYELLAVCCFNNGNLAGCVQLATALLKQDPYLMSTAVVMLAAFRADDKDGSKAGDVAAFLGRSFYDYSALKDRLFVLRAAISAGYEAMEQIMRGTFTPEELAAVNKALETSQKEKKLRIVMFYSDVESFNFFTDCLEEELIKRGHEIFILNLQGGSDESLHSYKHFNEFISEKVDVAICFDALAIRLERFVKLWDSHETVVVDIHMDPPLRFHPVLLNPPQKYLMFCCDREHVEYVKEYFGNTVNHVEFMPHVGVMPEKNVQVIPYKDRRYDILFCGTYYKPELRFSEIEKVCPKDSNTYSLYQSIFNNLKKNSRLSIWKGCLDTLQQSGMEISDIALKKLLGSISCIDWAIRMYQRERVVAALAESGLEIHLLGRGWENHPSAGRANVYRIHDRIPYRETLSYMADARINLNVMPGFKAGTHDRIFNTLLQYSLPLTDSSTWIDENFIDGTDIRLYDLDHLDRLPGIACEMLEDTGKAESIIQKGYEKVAGQWTWSHCANWILKAVEEVR